MKLKNGVRLPNNDKSYCFSSLKLFDIAIFTIVIFTIVTDKDGIKIKVIVSFVSSISSFPKKLSN